MLLSCVLRVAAHSAMPTFMLLSTSAGTSSGLQTSRCSTTRCVDKIVYMGLLGIRNVDCTMQLTVALTLDSMCQYIVLCSIYPVVSCREATGSSTEDSQPRKAIIQYLRNIHSLIMIYTSIHA